MASGKKRLQPEQWLKHLSAPSPNNLELERLFLDDHWRYGGLVHTVTADAFVEALSKPSDMAVGHGLFLRLFAEYATVLETLGAWGWTMRNRKDYPSLLDGFLAYGHNDPRAFFASVRRSRSSSLRLLLRLPADRKLLAATRAGSATRAMTKSGQHSVSASKRWRSQRATTLPGTRSSERPTTR